MGGTDTDGRGIDSDALVQLFAPEGKLRIVAAVLQEGADGEVFNPSRIYEYDDVSRDAWYRYYEDLIDVGLIEQDGKIGNSPVYRLRKDEPFVDHLQAMCSNLRS